MHALDDYVCQTKSHVAVPQHYRRRQRSTVDDREVAQERRVDDAVAQWRRRAAAQGQPNGRTGASCHLRMAFSVASKSDPSPKEMSTICPSTRNAGALCTPVAKPFSRCALTAGKYTSSSISAVNRAM